MSGFNRQAEQRSYQGIGFRIACGGWGALSEGAEVQADTDLTGDGIPEVMVNMYDPAYYKPGQPSPGQLLVFGCFQKGYRLLFSTDYSLHYP